MGENGTYTPTFCITPPGASKNPRVPLTRVIGHGSRTPLRKTTEKRIMAQSGERHALEKYTPDEDLQKDGCKSCRNNELFSKRFQGLSRRGGEVYRSFTPCFEPPAPAHSAEASTTATAGEQISVTPSTVTISITAPCPEVRTHSRSRNSLLLCDACCEFSTALAGEGTRGCFAKIMPSCLMLCLLFPSVRYAHDTVSRITPPVYHPP